MATRNIGLISAISMMLVTGFAVADVYTFVDEDGVRHISNIPDDNRYQLLARTKPGSAAARSAPATRNMLLASLRSPADKTGFDRIRYTIDRVSRALDLDPHLVRAVIRAESAFNADAVSNKGAVGLMQLMPATAVRYGVRNRRDPIQNVIGGARYLRDLLDEFNDVPLALAAYNAGENAVRRYGYAIPPYQETQTYVKRVQKFYAQYRDS